MALHRDILWIGKQWAVTGHGMQLIDQRLMGAFDIEVAHLWDDDLIASMHERAWLNTADFDQGLAVARARHQKPEPGSEPVPERPPSVAPSEIAAAAPEEPSPPLPPVEPAKPVSPAMEMKSNIGAKFARPWRAWMKKT
ncbi:hypothetical protein [Bradyrhizobium sp.]|jgi:hypothetical protein|uniref:hypothetical protein n=1 Tax=Bradyrhizobium sp. TaxID=376 RepID=UPI002C7728EF|nr:hypothetical protein [Bradyrhizobium sp.]HMM90737.1 hypothetical protein [Bradyrhizobium sp.]